MKLVSSLFAVLLLALSGLASAGSSIEIHKPWARTSPPGAPSAGFMLVKNTGTEDDVLLAVDGDFARKLELHLSHMVDGVMKMTEQEDGIVIPAGGEVLFKPGSYHLMFMGLDKPFMADETYTVQLTFKKAGVVEVELPVKDVNQSQSMHKH